MRRLSTFLVAIMLSTQSSAQDANPIADGAKVEKLAGGFKFTEGPAPDAEGNVYFTDQPNDRILKWSTDGKLDHLHGAVRPVERPVLRQGRQALGVRRREERAVDDRREDEGEDRCREGLRGQAAQRPERRLGPAGRRGVLHRPVLQARLLEARPEGAGQAQASISSRPKAS